MFDLTVATTGNNEKTLQKWGIPYEVVHIHPNSHAGYYPESSSIAFKLIFDKESGQIYGAQAIGRGGVDKRIDVIATAIKGNLTVEDLTNLELSYAPPYSSAKDPVNMAGYVAVNIVEGELEQIQWHEVDQIVQNGGYLLDVRESVEREFGYIEGSLNMSLGEIRERMAELPKNQPIYVSCQVGLRGYLASRILKNNGFNVKNVDGGWKTYSSAFADTEMAERTEGSSQTNEEIREDESFQIDTVLDVSGLTCPMPIVKLKQGMDQLESKQVLELQATDRGVLSDLPAWTKK